MAKTPLKPRSGHTHRHPLLRPLWMRRFRRRHRWLVRVILSVPFVLAIGFLVLTRTVVTRMIVMDRLGGLLNMEADADSAFIGFDGRLIIDRARFRIPGVKGPAGQFLSVAQVEVDVDWWTLLSGSADVRGLKLIEPVVVFSQSIDDRSLNIASLILPASSPGQGAIPAITLERAGIQIGEHTTGTFTLLRHVVMDGEFVPAPRAGAAGAADAYTFRLKETTLRQRRSADSAPPGFNVRGEINQGRVEVQLDNFSLDDWPGVSIPTPVRGVYQDFDLQGEVPSASLVYTPASGISATLNLAGVAMNLPIEPDMTLVGPPGMQLFGPAPRLMRMHGVSGVITFADDSVVAAVDGVVEDLPYRVRLNYNGISEDSPFTVRFESSGFRVEKNPNLLPYAPPAVRKWLQTFSSPVATVDTKMTISRGPAHGPPGAATPGEIAVTGELELKDGVASYSKFPYAFENLSGRFEFDNDTIKIVRITGRSASGADLVADGLISPLDETSEVTVNVDVKGVPIDDALQAAFGPGRGQVIRSLFNQERYQKLVDAELIQAPDIALAASRELEAQKKSLAGADPARAADIAARIADLERRLRIPAFEFGGRADVKVLVHAPRGRNVEYQTGIDIRIQKAGLIPEKFPMPVLARDVTVRVDNDFGRLTGGSFSSIAGGRADVEATFGIPSGDKPGEHPHITILASEIPFGELLINALPGAGDTAVKRILRDLKIVGTGSGSVVIQARRNEAGEPLGFDADLSFQGASLAPDPWPGAAPMLVTGVAGGLRGSEETLHADLTGTAGPGGAAPAMTAGPIVATIDAEFGTAASPGTSYRARVSCPGLDLHAPVESLIGVFSPAAAGRILTLRTEHSPDGATDVEAVVEADAGGGPPRVRVELAGASDLAFDVLGRRAQLAGPAGRVIVAAAGPVVLACSGVVAPLTFAGEPSGTLVLDGEYLLSDHGEARAGAVSGGPLRIGVRGGRFESTLVRTLLDAGTSAQNAATYWSYAPRGEFDATAVVARPAEGSTASPLVRGILQPRSIDADFAGTTVHIPELGGSIEVESGAGQLRELSARTPDWTVGVDGAWDTDPDGVMSLRSQWTASGATLAPDLRVMLPEELRSIMDQLEVRIDGPFSIEDAGLTLRRGPRDNAAAFSGDLVFANAAVSVGAELRGVTGDMKVDFASDSGGAPARYRLDIHAESLKVAGASVTGAHAVVHSGGSAGEVLIPLATADCYGGRVSARARVFPDGSEPGGPRRFEADTQISGVQFRPLLDELAAQLKQPGEPGPGPGDEPEPPESADYSRGIMDAEISLQGSVGRPETRRGRGSARVSGGRVLSFPFMTRMIEVSNLALPGNARLDYAAARFYIDGGLITFEDLAVVSKAVQILGFGTMTWPEKILDLRFNSQSSRPIPILSELLQGIRDGLLTTTVKGKLGEQEVRLQQFPGTRRMLGRAGGDTQDAQSRRMIELRQRAKSSGQSIRPTPMPPNPDVPTPPAPPGGQAPR